MPQIKADARRFAIAVLAAVAVGCDKAPGAPTGPPGPTEPPATLQKLQVKNADRLIVGKTVQMIAEGEYSDGSTRDFTSQATWSTSSERVATIAADGRATGIAPGAVNIQAVFESLSDSLTVTVLGPLWDVEFSMDYVECLADCDGAVSGAGEFVFSFELITPSERWEPLEFGNVSNPVELGNGDAYSIPTVLRRHRFEVRDQGGQSVYLTFRATEWDRTVSGQIVPDSRMDNRSSTAEYKYAITNWLPDGANFITIGDAGCRLRLHYRIARTSK